MQRRRRAEATLGGEHWLSSSGQARAPVPCPYTGLDATLAGGGTTSAVLSAAQLG